MENAYRSNFNVDTESTIIVKTGVTIIAVIAIITNALPLVLTVAITVPSRIAIISAIRKYSVTYFTAFEKIIPWIALLLLLFIGGKMLLEGIKDDDEDDENSKVGFSALIIQGIATSIDALSVGFTIAEYGFLSAFVCAVIIGVVTFIICFAGLVIGKRFGTRLASKASILGGIILIGIGIEIFIKGVL